LSPLKGQLHIHTTCSDGTLRPEEVSLIYAGRGFDFIAITDHDHLLKMNYRRAIEAVESDLLIFWGIELTVATRWGYVHVNHIEGDHEDLFIFNHPADYGLTLKETIQCIEEVNRCYPIGAVEVTNHGFYTPQFDIDPIEYPKVATDDSHTPTGCGRAWVEVNCARDKDLILNAIKSGNHKNCYIGNGGNRTTAIA